MSTRFIAMAIVVAVIFYFISNNGTYLLLLDATPHIEESVNRSNVICSDTGSTLLAAGGCSLPLSQELKYLAGKSKR